MCFACYDQLNIVYWLKAMQQNTAFPICPGIFPFLFFLFTCKIRMIKLQNKLVKKLVNL